MTKFKDMPGNKGLPEPRDGYEQCKVIHRKYNEAIERGWVKRLDKPWSDIDFVLCERKIKDLTYDNIVETLKESLEPLDVVVEVEMFPREPKDTIEIIPPTKKKGAK